MSELPEGWKMECVGGVADLIRGVTYGRSDATLIPTDGYLPLLRATNISEGRLVLDDFVFVQSEKVKPVQLLKEGDLVLAASSGSIQVVGKSAPVPLGFNGTFGAFCAALRPKESTNFKYLEFFISSPFVREVWSGLARGTNINNLKREHIVGTEIPLPPLAEQQRIVEILEEQFSRLDAALVSIRTVREKARAFRRSLLQAAFSGSLSNESVKFEPVPLQDLVDAKADITDGPFGSNLKSEHYTTSGPRVVRLANISSGSFINSFAHISTEHFATLQKHRVLAGDVLVATLGESIPRACVAPEYLGDAIVKADCIRIRPSRRVTPSFLSYAINSPVVRASAASMIQGVTRPRINLGALRTTVIPLPPLAEQCRITELIEKQFSRLDDALEITNQLELRITSGRRSLLHAAFSGTLTAQWRETHNG
jgi:type I restriction enzyme S subunit